MAQAKPIWKSTRARKPKQEPEFFSSLEPEDHLEDFNFPSLPLFQSPSGQTMQTATSPRSPVKRTANVNQRLQVLQLEKENLQLELQVLRLKEQSGKTTDESSQLLTSRKKHHVDWPNDFTPEPQAQSLQVLDNFCSKLLHLSHAESTHANIYAHCRAYRNFCLSFDLMPFPPTKLTIFRFIAYLVQLGH
jgi:hypothetical protein